MAKRRYSSPNAAFLPCHVDFAYRRSDADQRISRSCNSCRLSTEPAVFGISETEIGLSLKEWQTFTVIVVGITRRGLSHALPQPSRPAYAPQKFGDYIRKWPIPVDASQTERRKPWSTTRRLPHFKK